MKKKESPPIRGLLKQRLLNWKGIIYQRHAGPYKTSGQRTKEKIILLAVELEESAKSHIPKKSNPDVVLIQQVLFFFP